MELAGISAGCGAAPGSTSMVKGAIRGLGIRESVDRSFPYNFDYSAQSCLYVPKNLPDPSHPLFAEKAGEEIARLIEITGGGTFVLCTSYANLKTYEKYLRRLDYP